MTDAGPRVPWLYRLVRDTTGQSETLAVVLLAGLTITGAGVVVAVGGQAISGVQDSADLGRAEHAMTQLDSKASLVAHGSADTQGLTFSRADQGSLAVDEDAGWMRVRIVNETSGAVEETVLNESLGAVVYGSGQTTMAYQGGGVWRRNGNASRMVSPPEFHYTDGTLTLPLVLVRGSESVSSGDLRVTQDGQTTGQYPNASSDRGNPLDDGVVNVTVKSEYYRAWGEYFEQRTEGNVSVDHTDETVTIELTTPFDESYDNSVVATQSGGITANPGPAPSPSESGISYPTVDSRIEDRIDDCESGGCDSWTTTIASPGTYYSSSSFSGSMTIDTSGGDVELVVNGDFSPSDVTVNGGNNVTAYVRQDLAVNGDVNTGSFSGNADQFRTLVHTDGDIDLNGNYKYVGLIYAPGSEMDLNGGGPPSKTNVVGGVVGETVTINGNPNKFQYDASVDLIDLDLGSGGPQILYLHVSTTTVEVRDDVVSDGGGSATPTPTPTPTATPTPTPTPTPSNQAPTAAFTSSRKGKSQNVDLDASPSSDPDGTIVSYEWDVNDDGSIDYTGQTVSAKISSGTTVTLIVTDDDGETDSVTKTIS